MTGNHIQLTKCIKLETTNSNENLVAQPSAVRYVCQTPLVVSRAFQTSLPLVVRNFQVHFRLPWLFRNCTSFLDSSTLVVQYFQEHLRLPWVVQNFHVDFRLPCPQFFDRDKQWFLALLTLGNGSEHDQKRKRKVGRYSKRPTQKKEEAFQQSYSLLLSRE